MAEAITVNQYRRRLAAVMAGSHTALARIAYMAFGDGGHRADLTAKAPDAEQTALHHELLRVPLSEIVQEDDFSVTGIGAVDYGELIGIYLSEAGLFDLNGDLVGIKNFAPKIKESEERYEHRIKLRF